ncbi:hypothetical protein ASE07_23710 [Noviherbaspirillum sp. Root189]|nr:hypothetical protein ASE07_23710 [Noviherbaspirillum sp. Root189]
MNDVNVPVIVCFGLPMSFTCDLVDAITPKTAMWLICDTDFEALAAVDKRFETNPDVSLCVLSAFDNHNANVVLRMVMQYSKIEENCIWLSIEKNPFESELKLLRFINFSEKPAYISSNLEASAAKCSLDVSKASGLLNEIISIQRKTKS